MYSPRTILCLLFSSLLAAAQLMAKSEPPIRPQVVESYGKLPLSFEANQGQTDQRVKFLARGPGYTLFLTGDSAAVLSLHGKDANATLRMNLLGANRHAVVEGANALPGKSNYFLGNDPKQWRTNVPTYASVKYAAVYPGIDLVYHGDQRLLEYDFVVAPGADPRAIDLRFQGARKLSVNNDGALVIKVGGTEVIEHAPVVYQDIGGQRLTVAGRYVLRAKGRVGFRMANYDRGHPLVIDPTLVYSTFLGGNGRDLANGIAVDAAGNAYVTGSTTSSNFPVTPGTLQITFGGGAGNLLYGDAFVSKLNAAGSLVFSTFLGGGSADSATKIAVDVAGNAYVTGWTNSSNFPTTPGAFQTTLRGQQDTFVTKLNPAGSALIYSSYLGGEGASDIAVDTAGNAYITGTTYSADFPTTPGALQTSFGGGYQDAFVTKLNTAGSALAYSTFLGGSSWDTGRGIAVDAFGNAYVTGETFSNNFPTTPEAFQTTLGGQQNAFVTKLNATGSAMVYSTYVGGDYDYSFSIAVDALGNAYITGQVYPRPTFPTTPGAFRTTNQGGPFVTKLNAAGTALVYSTYLGGSYPDLGQGIKVDAWGNAYVIGKTVSSDFPTTPDAFQTNLPGSGGAFVSKLNSEGSGLRYATYLGPACCDFGIAVDAAGNAYATGGVWSSDFPTTSGALQTAYGGNGDAFVSKLGLGTLVLGPVTTANANGASGNNGWYLGPVTVTLITTAGGSPISATYYSVDGGPYQGYGAPFPISNDGTHQLMFYTVDTAGLQEAPHGQRIGIDSTKPASHIAVLHATASSPNFNVQWSGTDATSGIGGFTIYVSDNNGLFTPWLSQTTTTQAWFVGSIGHTYGFYSIARDSAGNQEFKTAAETTTQVPQMPGDVNGDGKINCADIAIVKASFGKRTGQPGFDPRADVNGDGVVDVRDLGIVSQKLIPGTSCP